MTKPNATSLGLTVRISSGAGGLSAQFPCCRFRAYVRSDKDEDSCMSYESNFGSTPKHTSIPDLPGWAGEDARRCRRDFRRTRLSDVWHPRSSFHLGRSDG